jgi:hypothetical protein
MTQIRITEISGGTFPVSVFISDVYGNNETLLGTISSGPVPPVVEYNTVVPPIFSTAPEIMLRLVDGNNCQVIKLLTCTFGCAFQITIELSSCVVNMNIEQSNCLFTVFSTDPDNNIVVI